MQNRKEILRTKFYFKLSFLWIFWHPVQSWRSLPQPLEKRDFSSKKTPAMHVCNQDNFRALLDTQLMAKEAQIDTCALMNLNGAKSPK